MRIPGLSVGEVTEWLRMVHRNCTLLGVENDAYHTVLEPGMALIVPPKWWHFVENLEPSLNFNTWIQLVELCDLGNDFKTDMIL